jgi:glycosyltransferase involved in cell wall biosynthesis
MPASDLKVLVLPANIASDLSHKVRALKTAGINARGLSYGSHSIQSADDIKVFNHSRNPASYGINRFLFYRQMYQWIKWADVLHWFWSFGKTKLDKKFVQWFDKPGVVQWGGSDIRIPEVDFADNPFYKKAFSDGYEYAFYESREQSLRNQKDFADVGFYPLEFIGMERYIDEKLFPERFRVWQSIVLDEHPPKFPDANQTRPLLLHSPSAPVVKGTKYILEAIENLKAKYDFDFKLVQGMPRRDALEIMSRCDVYIDQIILGCHGAAATEAMAFGKPVVGYINSVIGKNYPPELPIVNANPDNIAEKLEMLIKDSALRHKLGRQGREYVEKYHDDRKISQELIQIYKEVIQLHKSRREKK